MYVEAARLFNFTNVKLHPLDISDIEILEDVFPFVNTDDVVHNLELKNPDYNARGQGNIRFLCSADHGQDWQPRPVYPYSAICDDHTYIYIHTDVHNLELEKNDYNIAASNNADAAGHDLSAFWYTVAKDITLIQPPSAFMERVFSILRACLDERQETCYSDRIRASALLKYNRGRK